MTSMKVACVVLVMCMAVVPMAESAITCEYIDMILTPCFEYGGIMISTPCCSAVRRVDQTATTAADRQLTCRCLKTIAGNIGNIDQNIGNNLFVNICGADTPYKINPNADCSTLEAEEVVENVGLSNILTTL